MILGRLSPLLRFPAVAALSRDALLRLDPEVAHQATINALKLGLAPEPTAPPRPELETSIANLPLVNPIGMAAGFDKNAEVPDALFRIGFGFAEVGTLTPRPQKGNPRPRLFRIESANGVINRMGFNNQGHAAARARLEGRRQRGVLGINIGANKDSDDFIADYVKGVEAFASLGDYLAVNVSSPNTPGLRNLQGAEALKRLLGAVLNARARASVSVPIFLKIAPDLDETALDEIAEVIRPSGLDGLIVSNTTLTRTGVDGLPDAAQAGGLSGKPLFEPSTRRLAQMRQRIGVLPIIGVGGIDSAQTALAKIEAGADAIQLYSALIYGGLGLIESIADGLAKAVRRAGKRSIADLVGSRTDEWARGEL